MSNIETIRVLCRLNILDADIRKLESESLVDNKLLSELEKKIESGSVRKQDLEKEISALEKRKETAHSEVRSLNHQLHQSRDKMGKARNERETQAVGRELEELRGLLRTHEREEAKSGADLVVLQTEMEKVKAELLRVASELELRGGGLRQASTERLAEIESKKKLREDLGRSLPQVLFRKFDAICKKRGSGASSTVDGTCKACHIALPPQLFHRLQREPIIEQCTHCQRLVFFEHDGVFDPS